MPAFKRQLKPGLMLVTKTGEVYCYLGRYQRTPHSMYDMPEKGYLYLYCYDQDTRFTKRPAIEHIQSRSSFRSLDGHACYTKNPKQFESILGFEDVGSCQDVLDHIWGLTPVKEERKRQS